VSEQSYFSHPPPARPSSLTISQRVFARLVHPPKHPRSISALIVILICALIAWVYIASEGEFSRQAFYIIPMILAVSWLGLWWGLSVALFSAVIRFYGDVAFAGVEISNNDAFYAAVANRLSLLLVNFVVILVMHELYQLTRQLEERVQARTTALRQAVEARERLQTSLFEAGLRERKAIGRDLHDGLGQHLTATAMAASILTKRLASREDPLAADAREVESLIKAGIDQSRGIARGLLLETVRPDELFSELEELAASATHQHRTPCALTAEGSPERLDVNVASHLFYIAREALRNALRHGGATRIAIHFSVGRALAALTVTDNGRGLAAAPGAGSPPDAPTAGPRVGGMGLHIMSQRAELIGGKLQVGAAPGGGTRVDCRVPLGASA
jgi:signal transduction histidine kinase